MLGLNDPQPDVQAFSETCACNRTFTSPGAFKNHRNSCPTSKKLLSEALKTLRMKRKHDLEMTSLADSENPAPKQTDQLRGHSAAQMTVNNILIDSPPSTKCRRALPKRFRSPGLQMHDKKLADILPQPVVPLPSPLLLASVKQTDHPAMSSPIHSTTVVEASEDDIFQDGAHFDTARNSFGLFRRYFGRRTPPTRDAERQRSLKELSNFPSETQLLSTQAPTSVTTTDVSPSPTTPSLFHPFPNKSSMLLGDWFWNHGAQKSQRSFKQLLEIFKDDDFSLEDIKDIKWTQINTELSLNDWDEGEWVDEDAGWKRKSVKFQVPFHRFTESPGTRDYLVNDFYHRSLVSIIEEKLTRPHKNFHYEPFDLLWHPKPSMPPVQLHGECYSSLSFQIAHQELQRSPREDGCSLPRVVVALMFWSDSTHLTNFGNVNLWPLYLGFGNESKYDRCKPSCNLLEHVAYFERWSVLLDDDFVHAYKHGLVIQCPDGNERRFYPRIFTYSADYPEKTLMATIKQKGRLPCPRCKIPLSTVHLVGTLKDRKDRVRLQRVDNLQHRGLVNSTRKNIYNNNYAVDSQHVKNQLGPLSLLPISNAFSKRLSTFGFNLFLMFVVDLMHEIESGVWKALLIHLFRILLSVDVNLLHEMDMRFRQTPTFGRDTIRRFARNVSGLKQMAAWNYEDFLQCAIPVFDGLLPEPHNTDILRLLFHFAHWHGLAKLRLHHDLTLGILDQETTVLPELLRHFQSQTCAAFNTKELPRETEARQRRKAAKGRKNPNSVTSAASTNATEPGKRKASPTKQSGQARVTALPDCDSVVPPIPSKSPSNLERPENGSITMPSSQAHRRNTRKSGSNTRTVMESPMDLMQEDQPGTSHSQPKASSHSQTAGEHDPSSSTQHSGDTPAPAAMGSKIKKFNLNTYKAHALGDYVATIKRYGTTDSYSTEPGELEHRTPKGRYKRTSKRAFTKQLAQIERRQARLRYLKTKSISVQEAENQAEGRLDGSEQLILDAENAVDQPALHHQIGATENLPCHIGTFLHENSGDPATRDFLHTLCAHIASRLMDVFRKTRATESDSEPHATSDIDPNLIYIKRDTIFQHNIMKIHYTTYDVRRAQDIVNPKTDHRDIMLLSDDSDNNPHINCHQYRYARVIGIYHVNVIYGGYLFGKRSYEAQRMEFLWVRWFEHVHNVEVEDGWAMGRLDEVQFGRIERTGAFGFLDPQQVLRACHIIPRFSAGRHYTDGIGTSRFTQDGEDWNSYYAHSRFVDRDMLMCHHWGLGVGHIHSWPEITVNLNTTMVHADIPQELGANDNDSVEENMTENAITFEEPPVGNPIDDADGDQADEDSQGEEPMDDDDHYSDNDHWGTGAGFAAAESDESETEDSRGPVFSYD
ncbi:hypothetical protein Hypma_009855 [Hypsizygus marmoreus]|uniref:Uncharacterized protein n=1 Tax=Hypsizygus marmoreus TaxID=39966 RepID=A0A369JR60_HYPMA|nr:hypothetical protein Hypma_009855 [Hypsizygus marmoreus]